jgi:hypothetical protein
MRVISYECHNVKKVSDVKFDLEGRHLFLVGGKNGQGKSSSLDGILMALCGRSGMDYPGIALKNGEDEGWVKISLSGETEELHQPNGMRVELKMTRKRDKTVVEEFRILDSDGDEAPEPRTLLKRLYSLKAFDPLSFAKMEPKKRKLLIEELLDLDFSDQRAKYKELFDDRTIVNRDVAKTKSQLDGMPLHPKVEEVSASELMAELDRKRSTNEANRKRREAHEAGLRDVVNAGGVVARINAEISRLEEAIKAERVKLAAAEKDVEEKSRASAESVVAVAALVDEDCEAIRARIADVDSNNAKARANKLRAETLAKYNKLSEEAESLTEKMDKITKSVEKRTKEAEFPVEGMSLDSEGILLNGLPFEQASKREQIEASVDIGIALNPLLRLMVSQDGGALDDEAIETLDKKLAAADFQMIVEIATRSASDEELCAVVIKDGKILKSNPAKATATNGKSSGSLFADATA